MAPHTVSAARLKKRRDELFATAREDVRVLRALPRENAAAADEYFASRLEEIPSEDGTLQAASFCIAALGGYGRSELCPASDLDVLILFGKAVPPEAEALARDLFHPLWDLGLDLGHGVRDLSQCLGLAGDDPQVLASLLDARFLAGDRAVFDEFAACLSGTGDALVPAFVSRLATDADELDQGARDGASLLEPDLKNDAGGLRDCHRIHWLLSLATSLPAPPPPFTGEDLLRLNQARDFLLAARTALHLATGRKRDRLFLDLQPDIARNLGYEAASPALAAERFLADLHKSMAEIRVMRRALLRSQSPAPETNEGIPASIVSGPQGLGFADSLPLNHALVSDMFVSMAATGTTMAWPARKAVERFAQNARPFPETLETLAFLEKTFTGPHGGVAATAMLETGLLGAIFPRFKEVQDLVQFDAYHLHPLGRHTLETIRGLAEFDHEDEFAEILEKLRRSGRIPVLVWAAFFHDIAKDGPDHAENGARVARDILSGFGLEKDKAGECAFLIRHHLLLPVSASRIDLENETEVGRIAETIGSPERLDGLELLSVADARATGPKAWNSWSRSLMRELCLKLRNLLTQGPLARPHAAHLLLTARDKIRQKARGILEQGYVEARLDTMPQRYLLSRAPGDVVQDLQLVLRMEEALDKERVRRPGKLVGRGLTAIETRQASTPGCRQVTVAAPDQPGLFPAIAGALCLHGMDVHAAELFIFTNGTVLAIFTVSAPPDTLYPDETFARVGRSIHYALNGKLALGYRLERLRSSPLVRRRKPSGRPPEILVDNLANDFHTVLTVRADDRIGLLYDIAEALSSMFVQVRVAKIGSKIDRIEDVFYIRTDLGEKVTDKEHLRELKCALTHALTVRD